MTRMIFVKRIYIIGLQFCLCLPLSAQQIIERSVSKRPDWVGQVKENYLITSATAETLEDAQKKCLDAIKVQMLESVAQNIEYSTETIIEQITHNQDVQSGISFRQQGKTSVVNLPYISGVSLSNAECSYWECVRDKQNDKFSYVYSLLYPYPKIEYQRLRSEFEKLDMEMAGIVRRREKQVSEIYSIDTLEVGIVDLKIAESYFFDQQRKNKAISVIEQYEKVFGQLNVESKRIDRCKFRCWITWNGNVMECSSIPKCKSGSATKIKCTVDDESYIVTFSDEECISDDDNQIEVIFRFKYHTLKHNIYF